MGDKQGAGLAWDTYVSAPLSPEGLSRPGWAQVFERQRGQVERLLHTFAPDSVACLGAGFLNDLPIEALFHTASEIHFIDWIPDISLEGVRQRTIQTSPKLRCLFCSCDQPERYCRAFSGRDTPDAEVCTSYRAVDGHSTLCERYTPGAEPHFHEADVTAGRASHFARRMEKVVARSHSPKQAFQRAIRVCANLSNLEKRMPVQSDAFDLVTSSLVASQFDSEPYKFLSRLMLEKFGRAEILATEHLLIPLMEELRRHLFRIQMEGHASEMHRILKKDRGRAWFSAECFRTVPGKDDFFLVHESPGMLEVLGRFFHFDFETLAPDEALRAHPMGDGTSVVQSFVLVPRAEARPSS